MKHRGSISQTYIERNKTISKLYKQAKSKVSWPSSVYKICKYVSEMPTEKHYIPDASALNYVRKRYLHNIAISFKSPFKQRLYEHFYSVFSEMLASEKYKNMVFSDVALLALERPAPCCGLPPAAIQSIVHKHSKYRL